ncbi:HBL116Cp [Eremothecium sinecaudum]|uniref:HBL116Cp n=1 Tax=Eremothecium sinecaudum TaxID=45286 RepID=A0A125RDW7_9SACH|nr:HBL116Cp [Eremothecium sinecaudum]AMD18786.1 HBL116Cp [Eremothecium sinecaudum]
MLGTFVSRRFNSVHHGSVKVSLPSKPLRKIKLGKARPPIYHQFDMQVELSDGSVITRRSQYPKAEVRLIQDQRNSLLWSPTREDLVVVDANASGKMQKFKEKYNSIYSLGAPATSAKKGQQGASDKAVEGNSEEAQDSFDMDSYFGILSENAVEIKGGNLAKKTKKGK